MSSACPHVIDSRVIPPYDSGGGRTLVLCFDGTGNEFNLDNSNVVNFFSMLERDDPSKQIVYYQSGFGTYTSPHLLMPLEISISKLLDKAIAWNLDSHVMSGYKFLMQTYRKCDKICLFGFSRGAYTARALAGMLHKVGLLPLQNHQQVPFAYKMYKRTDDVGRSQSCAFKEAFCINVGIHFIGVWDTVCSVGVIPHHLPFVKSNNAIRTFRHAISLDEHRANFHVNHWHDDAEDAECPDECYCDHEHGRCVNRKTDVKEVWFAGCHKDVGGGAVENTVEFSLARISLKWMVQECFRTETGIRFCARRLEKFGLSSVTPSPLPPPFVESGPRVEYSYRRMSGATDVDKHVAASADVHASSSSSSSGGSYGGHSQESTIVDEKQDEQTTFMTDSTEPHGCHQDEGHAGVSLVVMQDEEQKDAMCEIHDALESGRWRVAWWILEILRWHWGRGRPVPYDKTRILVHDSVQYRINHMSAYTPRLAKWDDMLKSGSIEFVK